MRRSTEFLRENLDGQVRLSQLARECGLSVSHFARSFKATFGVSSHHWLIQRRVERAQELLSYSTIPLVEIAAQTGFGDQAAFTRTFHRVVGVSPGRWRRDRSSHSNALDESSDAHSHAGIRTAKQAHPHKSQQDSTIHESFGGTDNNESLLHLAAPRQH
jgi:AraC-like DNA-binding protein